jgi:hypothetical protein
MNYSKQIRIRSFEAEKVSVCARGAPQFQFVLPAFTEAESYRQSCLALDPAHNLSDPLGGKQIVFTGLHHDCTVSKSFGLTRAVEDFLSRHAVTPQGAIGLPQSAIHALPHAVTGNLNEAAQVHGIADALLAHRVSPLVQLREARGPLLTEPFENIEFG